MSLRADLLASNKNAVERDAIVLRAVQNKEVPSWVRSSWVSLIVADSSGNKLELFVMKDCLAIGSDSSPIYCPVSIKTAQAIANELGALIVTPKIVDAIFNDTRTLRVPFQGIPYSKTNEAYMSTSEAFLRHSDEVNTKVLGASNALVMGHSKTIALGPGLSRLGIYGAFGGKVRGWAIQGYPGPHDASWIDYADQLNLVSNDAVYNGKTVKLDADVFTVASRVGLVSYDGVAFSPRWPTTGASAPGGGGGASGPLVPPTTGGSATGSQTGGRRMISRANVGGAANFTEALVSIVVLPVLSAIVSIKR